MNDKTENEFEWLQGTVDEEMKKIYSSKTIELSKNPLNVGRIENADGKGMIKGLCGDTMEVYLKIVNDKVEEAKFFSDGCGILIACGSVVTEMAKNMSLAELTKISPYLVIKELKGLPKDDVHCAILSVNTLHQALADYLLKTFG
ncbi:iron-sulfur cluster assembly scaffold protein [bacterium]|nr:iron-sulfur cluster assembly scaffold protein [bacterium]